MNSSELQALVATLFLGYLSGSLPWGLWIGRWVRGVDIRLQGSGNLGATNVYRVLGPAWGIAVLLLDIAKGSLPAWLVPRLPFTAAFPGGGEWCGITAGLAAIAGHVWTFLSGFRGGKGVATAVGVVLVLAPLALAGFIVVFLLAVALTGFVSLGSVLGALSLPLTLAFTLPGGVRDPRFAMGLVLALVIVLRHRSNLVRMVKGQERRFVLRGGEPR